MAAGKGTMPSELEYDWLVHFVYEIHQSTSGDLWGER